MTSSFLMSCQVARTTFIDMNKYIRMSFKVNEEKGMNRGEPVCV